MSYCQWICHRNRLRAFTLLEMLIATTIMSIVMASALGLLIFSARMSSYTSVYTSCDVYGRRPLEMLKNAVRMSESFAISGGANSQEGNTLTVTNPDGTVVVYAYRDLDSNPETPENNQLVRRVGVNGSDEVVLKYVYGATQTPIFRSTGPVAPLTIRMRIAGYYPFDRARKVGIDVVTVVGPRNTRSVGAGG